jgi:hypothetical protein
MRSAIFLSANESSLGAASTKDLKLLWLPALH